MSGPVSPPLTVREADGSPSGRPINTIVVSNGDLSITGSTATIDTSGSGGTAALTRYQIGFGDASNLMTGSTKLTWDDTAGSEQLRILGSTTNAFLLVESTDTSASFSAPDLVLFRNPSDSSASDGDFIGTIDYKGLMTGGSSEGFYTRIITKILDADSATGSGALHFQVANGAVNTVNDSQIIIFGRTGSPGYTGPGLVSINNALNDVDTRISGDTLTNLLYADASQDNLGIGTTPTSGYTGSAVRTHILQANDGIALLLEDDQADAAVGPQMVFHRDSASPAADDILGRIRFEGDDTGGNPHGYSRITSQIRDPTDGAEYGRTLFENRANGQLYEVMRFDGSAVIFNNSGNAFQDVQINGDNDTILFSDASQDNLGLGTSAPSSDVERLHVKGTGTGDLVRLESTDGGDSSAPDLAFYRSSASPANNDYLGRIDFRGKDNAGNDQDYGLILGRILSSAGGSEDGAIILKAAQNGDTNPAQSNILIRNTSVSINDGNASYIDFFVKGDNDTIISCIASQDNVGIGTSPSAGGAQFQVNQDATFRSYIESFTSTGATSTEIVRNGTAVYDSGSAGVITVASTGVQGDKVTIVSVGSGGATLAFQPADSSVQTPASLSSGQSETWLCYKDNNWVKVASS